MNAGTILRYQFGGRKAIEEVAASRSAFWTGIVLVLLTAVARNYDQTHITEQPFLWLFGPLLFSVVSGTWLYFVAYAGFAMHKMELPTRGPLRPFRHWPAFMGLFWMTAPVAWLYAIPVERWFDSLTAAKVNVALLAIVSLWRVLLMSRVFQVLTKAPYEKALAWVLFPASVEVLVVVFFGGTLAKQVAAGMGGLRNSPEEEVLLGALGFAFGHALWLAPVSFIAAFAWPMKNLGTPLPERVESHMPTMMLLVAAILWIGIAVGPQAQVARNVHVERLMKAGQHREALDYLNRLQPGDFAPSRPLPPTAYGRKVFEQLPRVFAVIQPTDSEWVRQLMLRRLTELTGHFSHRRRESYAAAPPVEISISDMDFGLRYWPEPGDTLNKLLAGLERLPEQQAWTAANQSFLIALAEVATYSPVRHSYVDQPTSETEREGWKELRKTLARLGVRSSAGEQGIGLDRSTPAKAQPPGSTNNPPVP